MKRVIYLSLIALGVMLTSACSTYNYYKAGASTLNVSRYKSFAWMADPKEGEIRPLRNGKIYAGNVYYNNPQAVEAIKSATILSLQSKGLRQQNDDPDLLVHFSSTVGRGTRLDYYSAYPYWGWGGGWYRPYWGWGFGYGWGGYGGWGATYAVPENYKQGTIVIDLIDSKTRKIVWRGFGVGELHHNPQKTINELPKVIDGIFKQLPATM